MCQTVLVGGGMEQGKDGRVEDPQRERFIEQAYLVSNFTINRVCKDFGT